MSNVRRKHRLRIPQQRGKIARLVDSAPSTNKPNHISEPHKILQLQHRFGNQAVQRMLNDENFLQRQVLGPVDTLEPPTTATANVPVLGIGSQGPEVRRLQRRLNLHGANLVEDGAYGPATFHAVKQFQSTHNIQATGIVRQGTWTELNKEPITAIDQGKPIDRDPAELPLSDLPVGKFAGAVSAGFMDHDIAALLNDVQNTVPRGGFALSAVNYALEQLNNGEMIGLVSASRIGTLRQRTPFTFHSTIADVEKNGVVVNGIVRKAMQITRVINGEQRGMIVVNDVDLAEARAAGTTEARRLMQQVLLHEITHQRNREEVQVNLTTPITPEEYVDVPEALRLQEFGKPRPTTQIRAGVIEELTAQHIEFLVKQERIEAEGGIPDPLLPGEFFNAAVDFAKNNKDRIGDNGYLAKLIETDEALFRKQIAIWMRNLNIRDFHSDPLKNALKRSFFEIEFNLVKAANFSKIAARSRGLRD